MLYILAGKGQGKSFILVPSKEYTVGRHSGDDIKIEDENISRNHFKIQIKGNKYFIMDLHSKNGTFVGNKKLSPGIETEVKEGVPIVIGMTILGLGEVCESILKPILGSTGFFNKMSEDRDDIEVYRVRNTKMNLKFIYAVTSSLMESKDRKEIAKKFLNYIFYILKRIDRCVILLIDDQTEEIRYIIYRSRKHVDDPTKVYNREIVEQALKMKKPVMIKDSYNIKDGDKDVDDNVTATLQLMKIRSAMCMPIVGRYGIRGAIYVDSIEKPDGFQSSDLSILNDVCIRAAIAMDNVSLQMS